MICILLLVSGALAGCTNKDKDDDEAPVGNPFVVRDADQPPPDTIHDYVRYYNEQPPESCEGCVRLETRDRAVHDHPQPETAPGVLVPLPAIGDHVGVKGVRRAATGPELGPMPLATTDEAYSIDVVFEGVVNQPMQFTGDGTLAHFRIVVADGAYPVHGASFRPSATDLFVDPQTRAVVLADATGHGVERPDDHVGVYSSSRPADARHLFLPAAENLFWLGSHLWGRTWFEGDTHVVAWTPPGTDAPTLWYEYEVTKAQTVAVADTGPHEHAHTPPSPNEPRSEMRVNVAVHDHFGKMRRWELRFDGASPYPYHLRLTRDMHASVEPSLVPGKILAQSTRLVQRGADPGPWPPEIGNAAAERPRWGDVTYRINERVASPALDTLPVYPLRAALDDLVRLDPGFADWWGSGSDALLIDARLGPRLVSNGANSVHELEWRLTFLDDADTRAWTVARMSTIAGVVAPSAHRAASGTGAEVPSSLRHMDPGDHADARLSAGDDLARALQAAMIDGAPIDSAHYALTHTIQGGIGGTLLVGQARIPQTSSDVSGTPGGYVVQELRTGAVVESLAFTET